MSFASVQAFKDIYGPPSKTRKLFTKSDLFYDTGIQSIVYEMDPEEHAKQYKLFAPSFRASAVRSQEHVVQDHVDLFVSQLRYRGEAGIDATAWFEWLAFDIIGKFCSIANQVAPLLTRSIQASYPSGSHSAL